MLYYLSVRNPKTGRMEAYNARIKDIEDIALILDIWRHDAGYEIVSFKGGVAA